MIQLKEVCKFYQVGDDRVRALDHATLHIRPREFVSIIGPSGSGKSTLMNIIGCLDIADAGSYKLDDLPIEAYTEKSKNKLLQAMLLDPTVSNYNNAVALIDEMFQREKEILPELHW